MQSEFNSEKIYKQRAEIILKHKIFWKIMIINVEAEEKLKTVLKF